MKDIYKAFKKVVVDACNFIISKFDEEINPEQVLDETEVVKGEVVLEVDVLDMDVDEMKETTSTEIIKRQGPAKRSVKRAYNEPDADIEKAEKKKAKLD